MFGIGGIELFIIVVFVLLVFGPEKLPQFGRTIGQFMREFKRAQESMEAVIRAEVYSSENKSNPANTADMEPRRRKKKAAVGEAEGEIDEEADEEAEEALSAEPAKKPLSKNPFENVAPDDYDEEEEEEE